MNPVGAPGMNPAGGPQHRPSGGVVTIMTISRGLLPLMLLGLAGSVAATSAVAAAPTPQPQKAPGRVVFSVDGGAVSSNDDGGGASAAVPLPDGGAVLVGNGGVTGQFHTYAAEINADGSLNPAFATGGIATLPGITAYQVVREADGSLIVAGSGATTDSAAFPPIVLLHLEADGALDPGFGTGGIDTLPIESSCGDCAAISVEPSGRLVVTGDTGRDVSELGRHPSIVAETQWVVAALTPNGALDPSFGRSGIVTLVQSEADGTAVGALADGDIVALGNVSGSGRTVAVLTRLLPSGAADPAFSGGNLIAVPGGAGTDMIAEPDGDVLVDASAAIVRYTAAGLPDPTFASGGVAPLTGFTAAAVLPPPVPPEQTVPTRLLPSPGDGAVVYNVGDSGVVLVERLSANGSPDPTLGGSTTAKRIALGFGGGSGGFVVSVRPRPLPPLAQDSADIRGAIVERANGSFLAVNGVSVLKGTGEGEGDGEGEQEGIFDFAVAGLTPSFAPDPTVGGPATPLYAKLRVIRQHASTDYTRHGILVELTLSEPGLARVVIKADGRVVAQNVLPVPDAGESTLPVELTAYGNQLLRNGHGIELTATLTGRDLLTNTATSTASGTLR
jgi:uncharacterized delta-60 repeat protein